jgi:Holliday junction resolvase
MSSGRAPRQKGDRFERSIIRLLQDRGIGAERVPLSGSAGGKYSGDRSVPFCGRDLIVEAKSRGSGFRQLYRWLEGRDALVVRADRCDALVVLPLRLAAQILLKAEGRKA